MPPVTIPMSGFAFGEYGSQSPFSVGFAVFRQHLLYRGWWTGRNIVRTLDGALIPCPQPKQQTVTGLPATAFPSNLGIAYANGAPGNLSQRVHWYKSGTTIYQAAGGYAFSAIGGAAPGGNIDDLVSLGSATYLAAGNGGVYKIDHSAPSVATIAGSAKGNVVCSFGDRLYVAGDAGGTGTFGNRVYFSAPGDFTSWPAQNYFDVGTPAAPIIALVPIRHMLLIAKSTGNDTTWWTMTGVPGYNNVLRRVGLSPTPAWPYAIAPLADNTAAFYTTTPTGSSTGAPGIFNGVHAADLRYLAGLCGDNNAEVYRLREESDLMVTGANGITLLRREGAWTAHDWSALNLRTGQGFRGVASDPIQDTYMFSSLSGSSPYTVNLYEWKAYHQRPAFTTDTQGAIPPASSCFFTLPEWWTRSGEEVAVDAVWVDFVAWDTGDTNPNTFTINAVAMRTYDPVSTGGGPIAGVDNSVDNGGAVTFSEATSKASTSGSRRRMTANFTGRNWGNGFRIDVSNLRGVSIEKIVVEANVRPAQGV